MVVETRDFGALEIQNEDVIRFSQPIYGFEQLTEYVMITESSLCSPFVWLQSLQERDICFILIRPDAVDEHYSPAIPDDTLQALGGEACACEYWCIVVIPEDYRKTTVNLKSPIVLCPSRHIAAQVILDDNYPIRCPLMQQGKEEAAC